MNTQTKAIAGVAAAFIAGAGWWMLRHAASRPGKPELEPRIERGQLSGGEAASAIAGSLRDSKSPASNAAALAELKRILQSMPASGATAWIVARLNTGEDTATGLGFVIGSDHNLSEWPTLRVFLLDVILGIDPAAAADLGRRVLQIPTTADEWALAMRNLGSGSPGAADIALLKAKSAEMLRNGAWSKEASAGYLESFDVIVHTRNVELAPELISRAKDTANRGVRHAAFLTLDRLTLADPGAMMEELIPSAIAQPETALMVSNMVARTDVSDPAQRRLVENYLLDERRTAAEMQAFTGVFPNANQMVSHNLLTETLTVDGSARAVQDRAALGVVEEWVSDARFARLHEQLRSTRERLRGFVRPEGGN